MKIPHLIAHRGYAYDFPENTLISIEAALKAGALFVEFDVQLCADAIPIVCHDVNLKRTASLECNILDMTWQQISTVSVHVPDKFGVKYKNTPIPTLAEVAKLLAQWPHSTAFVEIKRRSIAQFGVDTTVENIMSVLKPIINQCVLISYNVESLKLVRQFGAQSIGWVSDNWTKQELNDAVNLDPQFMFTEHTAFPEKLESPWAGPWQWALYNVDDPQLALNYAQRGADFIETYAIGTMLKHPLLNQGNKIES